MNIDFTLKKFSQLCEIVSSTYPTITLNTYLSGNHPDKFIIMRHDVDRKIKNSLKTAKIENNFGITSTYYFRMNNNVFQPEIIKEIKDMGHEIGYHYEVLGKTKGDYEKAIKLFEYELAEFRRICDITTICMHGNPLSKYDNRSLWKTYNFKNYGILGEAYLSAGDDLNYFSDTGRWNSKNNIRDFLYGKIKTNNKVNNTDDLIELIKNNKINNLYILTHPERWSSNTTEWSYNYLLDKIFNIGKLLLKSIREIK